MPTCSRSSGWPTSPTAPTTCSPTPDTAWSWLTNGYRFVPESADDRVTWSYDHADSPWHVAFTPGMRAIDVVAGDGEVLVRDGVPTRVDLDEVRAHAAEQAARLFERL